MNGILNLIESVSEGFPSYSGMYGIFDNVFCTYKYALTALVFKVSGRWNSSMYGMSAMRVITFWYERNVKYK